MQSTCRQPGIEVHGTVGHRLQLLQQVQTDHPHGIGIVVEGTMSKRSHRVRPFANVPVAQIAVAAELAQQPLRGFTRFGDGVVAAGEVVAIFSTVTDSPGDTDTT